MRQKKAKINRNKAVFMQGDSLKNKMLSKTPKI